MGRATRREFSVSDVVAIVRRATDSSFRIHCEKCGIWCKGRKNYQIDHVSPEGMRPTADRKRKLGPADGQLLCVAVCHPDKTKLDKGDIGEAKRREAYAAGVERPGKVKIRCRVKAPKEPLKVAAGAPRIAREYGQTR